jgi:CheY-like chemotaxis protein
MLASASPRPTESKFRILYLGSDLELVSALRNVLMEPDYRLITCSEMESAVLFLKSHIPYQLLLIDFEWRGRDGLNVARVAHQLRHRKRMPIILVAATELTKRLKAVARQAGVSECVTKTADMQRVIEAIRRYLVAGSTVVR